MIASEQARYRGMILDPCCSCLSGVCNVLVVVGNVKGGCGKTTISVNIAAAGAAQGKRVLLLDADAGQLSSSRWASMRRERHPSLPQVLSVGLTGSQVTQELEQFAESYDLVIVDTAPEDSPQMRGAIVVADVLVIPVQQDELDLWTLPTMGALVTGARRINPDLGVVVVLNRLLHHTAARVPGEIKQWISENAKGLADAPLVSLVGRTAYGKTTGDGLGVGESSSRDAKAASEIVGLFKEISKYERSTSQPLRREAGPDKRSRRR